MEPIPQFTAYLLNIANVDFTEKEKAMEISICPSDRDDSYLEGLTQLSDWDTNSETESRASSRLMRRVNYMQTLEDVDFTFRFRLSKSACQSLLLKLMPYIRVTSSRNYGVSPLHQLLLTLRFYALGTMLISVADFVGVSASTAGRIVYDISSVIANLYDEYIVVHQQSAEKCYQIGGFPTVLAAIDCTHVRIQSPCHVIGEEFRNRKGYFPSMSKQYVIQRCCVSQADAAARS